MTLVSFTRQANHVRPCQDMALINYDKAKIPCKTMPRHCNGEFIKQGYHVRPCQDMAMVSLKRKGTHVSLVFQMVQRKIQKVYQREGKISPCSKGSGYLDNSFRMLFFLYMQTY